MRKRKCSLRLVIPLFLAVFSLSLVLGLSVSPAQAKDDVWKLKIQAFTVPGKFDCQWVGPEKLIALIDKHTKGRVKCSLHPVGELVGAREIWTGVSGGTIDGGATLDIYEGGTHPMLCFDVGAIWSIDEFFKVMHGGALDILNKQIASENVRIVGFFPLMNYYAVSMKTAHVKKLEDLKGKKIRGMGGAANLFLQEAGAGIVTLPMSEVPAALQTGVVNGIHTGMAGLYAMNLWDVAPYFTSTRSGNFGFFFLMNESLYQKFPKEVKDGIAAAQTEFEDWYKKWDATFWKEIRADVEKKGVKWYFVTNEESARWRKLLTKVSVKWVNEKAPGVGKELFGVVEKVTGRKIQ